jgi:signal recognition particle subunit SRP54
MFDELSNKLQALSKKINNQGFLNEENTQSILQEVKIALLEADVNFRVVNSFIKKVKEKSSGREVIGSLSPAQQFIQVIFEELKTLLGAQNESFKIQAGKTHFILLLGLQGSGKTTTAAKLGLKLKKQNKKLLLVPADIYRPAAIDQLKILAQKIEVDCFDTDAKMSVNDIVQKAKEQAHTIAADVVIVDTAGRLQINQELMQELEDIKKIIDFQDTLLVLDAMTGQEALNIAKAFHQRIDITGFILTKMDSDARGGAAVSIRAITEKPIKMIGVGEKIEDLEDFHPDRVASKILGMGDVLTLVEKVQKQFEGQDLQSMEERLKKNQFNLLDFEMQLQQLGKMGSLKSVLGMLPGINLPKNAELNEGPMKKFGYILSSMTKKEKMEPNIINGSRRQRIAKGSGTETSDVNQLFKQFLTMKKMMKKFSGGGRKNAMKELQNMMGGQGGFPL